MAFNDMIDYWLPSIDQYFRCIHNGFSLPFFGILKFWLWVPNISDRNEITFEEIWSSRQLDLLLKFTVPV
jgi:hypothetical protein